MFPIATTMNGTAMAFPDVCKTPMPPAGPVPMPYPNTAMLLQANPMTCSKKVKILFMPVLVLGSKIPMTAGDEAGAAGGVVSNTIKGPAGFSRGSMKVSVEGQPVVFQTCTTMHNGMSANAPIGVLMAPSQAKVTVMM